MLDFVSTDALSALLQVVLIDLVLAGDNAIVIALASAGLPRAQRSKAILFGIAAATLLRILFAGIATWLLAIIGLLLAGGILLLWVCWKMWRELRVSPTAHDAAAGALADQDANGGAQKAFRQAVWQIVVADVSMSLDNVLAVAGAAREHPIVLVFGLGLSIALMGLAATFIARLLSRYPWIAYVGLAIILYVALKMIWEGAFEIHEAIALLSPLDPGALWAALRPDLVADVLGADTPSSVEIAELPRASWCLAPAAQV